LSFCFEGAAMKIFTLEHSPLSYAADFVLYPLAILSGLVAALFYVSMAHWPTLAMAFVAGLLAWSLIEYVLHRHVLHGVQPFKRWHEEHHDRPFALIGTSTIASLLLFGVLVFAPLALAAGIWPALTATLGVMSGYLFYVTVHHAVHHWKTRQGSWLHARKQAHARHHQSGYCGSYGVTTAFWDKVFKAR
jgi:hypothetical protein